MALAKLWIMAALLILAAPVAALRAEPLTALARALESSRIAEARAAGAPGAITLQLDLSRAVPWRVFTLADPWRLVLDFSEVDWAGFDAAAFDPSEVAAAVRTGVMRPGWTRMVLELRRPFRIAAAEMRTGARADDGPVQLHLAMEPGSEAAARAAAGAPAAALFELPEPAVAMQQPHRRQDGSRPLVVAIDPGHGGLDPGAERAGLREADLVLAFALELEEVLLRAGFRVVMTRRADVFVPLETRVSIARAGLADVFLSLHADTVAEGNARGISVYTLSGAVADAASRQLAERHDRDDLLAGVDLTGTEDELAIVLMELARAETDPRALRLAGALVEGFREAVGGLYSRPHMTAEFSVLKAPEIPSVLIELGYLSSGRDRALLQDADWRAKAQEGMRAALSAWAAADAAEARLIRQ